MNAKLPARTRRSERNRLALHLAATLSYLWLKALLAALPVVRTGLRI